MATYCPVAPARILGGLYQESPRLVRHNLFLAHDVVKDPESYRDIFGIKTGFKHFSFMDNSLVELKQAVDLEMVADAVDITRSRVYVVPDVYGDGVGTVGAVRTHYDLWKATIKNAEPMVVIQGKDFEEWLWCLQELSRWRKFPWIAVPRVALEWIPSRRILVDYVKALQPLAKIHLLGFGDKIYQDLWDCMHPDVSSIDSAVPVRMGYPFLIMKDAGPRGDWWDTATYNKGMAENVITAKDLFHRSKDSSTELPS